MQRRFTLILTLLLMTLLPSVAAADEIDDEVVIDYNGQLQDQKATPISGVFHLAFKLYESKTAANPAWVEHHFLAVVDGSYSVPLGAAESLNREDIPVDAWIGVELVGEGELLRDRFAMGLDKQEEKQVDAQEREFSEASRKLLEQASDGKRIAYADIAERAVTADRAEVATRAESIGEFSVEELEEKAQRALDRLGEHIADPDAHEATGGLRVGDERKVQKRIGGSGGKNYEVNCPPGYVVTGLTGGAGRLVDSIRIVCSKLR